MKGAPQMLLSYGFGPKIAWIAVADASADEIASLLEIGVMEPATWEAAIDHAYAHAGPGSKGTGVLITPKLKQWILCAGVS